MSGQGYHVAVSESQEKELLECHDESRILERVNELLELLQITQPEEIHGGYKDWNILLLCLTDGTYDPQGGTYPLNHCFFGGKLLVSEGSIVNLVVPAAARDVAALLATLDEKWFRNQFSALFAKKYKGVIPVDEYESFYQKLQALRDWYNKVAREAMGAVFYTDDCLSYFFDPSRNPPNRM